MKTLLMTAAALFLSTSLSAFAGPNGPQELTCYKADAAVPAEAPAKVCLGDVGLYDDGDEPWLQIFGGDLEGRYPVVPEFSGNKLVGYSASKPVYHNVGEGCSAEDMGTLIIGFPAERLGDIRPDGLTVSLQLTHTDNNCRGPAARVTLVTYQLVK